MRSLVIVLLATLAFPCWAADPAYQQQILELKASDGKLVQAVLTTPAGGMNTQSPAVVHIQGGPGASPLEGSGNWIAQGLAGNGYTVLQPMARHGDQLYTFSFEGTDKDIAAAADFLSALGFRDLVLAGSSFGSITATRYLIDRKDARVKATLHFAPTADMSTYVRTGMGDANYWKAVEEASALVSAGKGDAIFAPVFDAPSPPAPKGSKGRFIHSAKTWLDMWGPTSSGMNTLLFPQIDIPVLLLVGDQDPFNSKAMVDNLKTKATGAPKVDFFYYDGGVNHSFYPVEAQRKAVVDVAKWLAGVGLGMSPQVRTEIVTVNEDRMGLGMQRGIRYRPAAGAKGATGYIILHDWDADAFHGLPHALGEALAGTGATAFGVNVARAQLGMLGASYERTNRDIKLWVDEAAKEGLKNIVLVGHGLGAMRAARYVAVTKDARVTRAAYVAPIVDPATLLSTALDGDYRQLLAQAEAAVAAGKGNETIIQGMTKDKHPVVMLAEPFQKVWAPGTPVLAESIRTGGIPVLMVGRSGDANVNGAAWQEMIAENKASKVLRYGTTRAPNHDFAGYERRLAADLAAWAGGAVRP